MIEAVSFFISNPSPTGIVMSVVILRNQCEAVVSPVLVAPRQNKVLSLNSDSVTSSGQRA